MPFLVYPCDPAHAVGSTDGPVIAREFRRTHRCPECPAEFASAVDLGDHLTTEHPIPQPHLLLGGTRVPGNWIIRQPVDSAGLRIMNATEVDLSINGASLRATSAAAFRQILDEMREGVLELHLHNRGALQRYDIRILIPEGRELHRLEDEFMTRLARDDVTVSDVRRFDEAISVGPSAREYASGLADYVYGMLAKDGAGQTTLPFAVFPDKLKRSLGVLGTFERPLATAIANCIRFNLNDFRSAWKPCGVRVLDHAFRIFRQLALGKTPGSTVLLPDENGIEHPLCPVDATTQSILSLIDSPTQLTALRDMTLRHDLSDADRVKVYVLLAAQAVDLTPEDIAACQAALEYHPVFGNWANGIVRGLG